MTPEQLNSILREVVDGARDPLSAADDILATGDFMLGSVGADMAEHTPDAGLRLQALMGRLMWLTLSRGGATDLPHLDGLAAYRDFFLAALAAEGDFAEPADP